MKFIPSVGWRMSAVKSGSSPTVLHLSPPPFCSRPKLIASRTKSAEKSIYEIKNRIYEKDPLNCWYSMQNRRKQNRITKSQQTFFDFFSQNRGYFPLFLLINIWNTISCRSGTAHPQRLRALLTGHNIYICIKFIGAPIVVPRFAFLPSNLPFSIRFLNQEFASKESKSVCGYQSFRMRWLICGWKSVGIWGGKNQSETTYKKCVTYWYIMVKRKGNKLKSLYRKCL